MEDKLKLCPWCGSTPEMEPWHGGKPTKVRIDCSNEHCDVAPAVTGETPKEAIKRWNTRAPLPDAERRRIRAEAFQQIAGWIRAGTHMSPSEEARWIELWDEPEHAAEELKANG